MVSACLLATACGGSEINEAVGAPSPPGTEAPFLGLVTQRGFFSPTPLPTGQTQTSAFCQDVEELQQVFPTLLLPNAAGASFNQAQSLLNRLPSDAPAAIRTDATALVQAMKRIGADLASQPANGSDLAGAIPELQQSFQQVMGYAAVNC